MVDNSSLGVVVVVIVGMSAIGWILYSELTPYPNPIIEQGNITKLYIIPGQEGGIIRILNPSEPDKFYMVLNREKEYSITHNEFIRINEGDEVKITFYSPMEREIKIVRRGEG